MYLDGTVFNGTGWFRKTGASNNANQGGLFDIVDAWLLTGAAIATAAVLFGSA